MTQSTRQIQLAGIPPITFSGRGPWMATRSGKKFHLLDPSPSEVDPSDLCHALARIGRFGGHTSELYSVAQHSAMVRDIVRDLRYRDGGQIERWALLHDAAEAYIGDIIYPLKIALPAIKDIENRILEAIGQRFNIRMLSSSAWAAIKEADRRALMTEASQLMPRDQLQEWDCWDPSAIVEGVEIVIWPPVRAEYEYGNRLEELFPGIGVNG